MRALRDFNVPKIIADDLPIFMGLLSDLFPGINPPRARNMEFENAVEQECTGHLYGDPDFILKVVQLRELMEIRHCVFVMGPAGAGKSETWKTLGKAISNFDSTPVVMKDINPKSITSFELFGFMSLATREWNDGLLPKVMRDLSRVPDQNPKWMVLDGDLDANWIENMNRSVTAFVCPELSFCLP